MSYQRQTACLALVAILSLFLFIGRTEGGFFEESSTFQEAIIPGMGMPMGGYRMGPGLGMGAGYPMGAGYGMGMGMGGEVVSSTQTVVEGVGPMGRLPHMHHPHMGVVF